MKQKLYLFLLFISVFMSGYSQTLKKDIVRLDLRTQLEYCKVHTLNTLANIPNDGKSLPMGISRKSKEWEYVDYKNWTSGFWPGQLWYVYETTHDKRILAAAEKYTQYLLPLSNSKITGRFGVQILSSFGNAFELTGKKEYKQVILHAADSLAAMFNSKTGTIRTRGPVYENNMMNLELLFWAAKHGGGKKIYDIALKHAETTMQNHFGPDYTSYDIVIYDEMDNVISQSYVDDRRSRDQAFDIYAFTIAYRETGKRKFLDFAHKITRVYLDKLPNDMIPSWDFNDAAPLAPKDASAAAITASALLELATFTKDSKLKREYEEKAMKMITELTNKYQSRYVNNALLLFQSPGNNPDESDLAGSVIYADYYYMECLARLEKLMWVKRFF